MISKDPSTSISVSKCLNHEVFKGRPRRKNNILYNNHSGPTHKFGNRNESSDLYKSPSSISQSKTSECYNSEQAKSFSNQKVQNKSQEKIRSIEFSNSVPVNANIHKIIEEECGLRCQSREEAKFRGRVYSKSLFSNMKSLNL